MDAAHPITPSGFESGPPAEGLSRVTPMMEQYIEIKAANPDCLLFYRMGDFYELFFEDAEVAARALGIVLTKRGKHLGRDIPMCGVPVERAEEYLHRLIALGHRVAVCEQLEDPAEARRRGGKSVVRRDIVRLVTPGTLTEDSLLDARRNNYLAAIARARSSSAEEESRFAIAFLDISTGEFRVTECGRETLAAEVARLEPGEILVSDALYEDAELASFWRSLPAVTPLTRDAFDGASAERRLAEYFAVATTQAFGAFSRLELTAAAACVTYLERTQRGEKPLLSPPARESGGATLLIDAATRANLELVRTSSGERRGSLLSAIDRTVTAAGSRLLAQRLAAPLTAPAAIGERLDSVAALVAAAAIRSERSCGGPRRPDGGGGNCRGVPGARSLSGRDRRRRGCAASPRPGERRRARGRACRRAAGLQARRRIHPRRLPRRARRDAGAARRVPPRPCRAPGPLCRGHRHSHAEDPSQPRARLF